MPRPQDLSPELVKKLKEKEVAKRLLKIIYEENKRAQEEKKQKEDKNKAQRENKVQMEEEEEEDKRKKVLKKNLAQAKNKISHKKVRKYM